VRRRLSVWIDGELGSDEARDLAAHLGECASCRRRADELRRLSQMVGDLPFLEAAEPVAQAVLTRLEVETRGPGLGFLLRRFGAARPYMVPSLVPAALVLVTVLSAGVALDSGVGPRPAGSFATWGVVPASGTESNPLFPSAEVGLPHPHGAEPLTEATLMAAPGDGPLFVETVVARDGTVSYVTLLHGDPRGAGPLLEALRRQRFEPVRYQGRPVAVSFYRLISRMEVRSPQT
jgi:hypothetical protein